MKFKRILSGILIIFLILIAYFFVGKPEKAEKIIFGVNFSQKHSAGLELDWKENYLALLDDLEVREIKLLTHWDLLEPERDNFSFGDLDWQINEAGKREAKIILVMGMKTGRWPECHIPEWAKELEKKEQQERILKLIQEIVLRYSQLEAINVWQVENEPFFSFGTCPWKSKDFLKQEVDLVRSLDPSRPILITDSGEGSLWIEAAKLGDIVGTTMYKKVWIDQLNRYVDYLIPSIFYRRKADLIQKVFNKEVMIVELQAEPWGPKLLYDLPLEEQKKTMNLEQFKYNIDFAEETGFEKIYLWGAEWWYWMKTKQEQPEIWIEAKSLF